MTEHASPDERRPAVLDDAALRRWMVRSADALRRHRHRLDALNVFPVPDGDTGTNLHLTLDQAVQGFVRGLVGRGAEEPAAGGITAGVQALARQCLLSARGNSGVILSQFVAGLAAAVRRRDDVDRAGIGPDLLVDALEEADRRARAAVVAPVEGTILTVMRAAAQAGRQALRAGAESVGQVAEAAATAARNALAETPTQLEALARAGVVDAGGAGLVVVLDTLLDVIHGRTREEVDEEPAHVARTSHVPDPPISPSYEVMYLMDGVTDRAAARLTGRLAELGDSLVVAGDESVRTVHVHTPDVGAAIEAALEIGRPYGLRITVLSEEIACDGDRPDGPHPHGEAAGEAEPTPEESHDAGAGPDAIDVRAFGVVACVQAPGLAEAFEAAGVSVVPDSPGRRATPAQLLDAVRSTGRSRVVVLPDDGDIVLAARAAAAVAAEEGFEVEVIPTAHLLQGWAAVAVMDLGDPDSIGAMIRAAEAVRYGTVATATAPARTGVGECRPGDVLAFVGDEVTHVGQDAVEVASALALDLLGEDGELVTLVEGADARGLGERVAAALDRDDLEVEIRHGGQSVYDLFVGVE